MTAEWKQLTDKERAKWDKAAEEDKNRYLRENKEYVPEGDDSKAKVKSKSAAAATEPAEKKPLSGYMHFGKDFREKLAKSKQEVGAKDIMRKIGEAWKALSDKEKEKWNSLAKSGKSEPSKPASKKS